MELELKQKKERAHEALARLSGIAIRETVRGIATISIREKVLEEIRGYEVDILNLIIAVDTSVESKTSNVKFKMGDRVGCNSGPKGGTICSEVFFIRGEEAYMVRWPKEYGTQGCFAFQLYHLFSFKVGDWVRFIDRPGVSGTITNINTNSYFRYEFIPSDSTLKCPKWYGGDKIELVPEFQSGDIIRVIDKPERTGTVIGEICQRSLIQVKWAEETSAIRREYIEHTTKFHKGDRVRHNMDPRLVGVIEEVVGHSHTAFYKILWDDNRREACWENQLEISIKPIPILVKPNLGFKVGDKVAEVGSSAEGVITDVGYGYGPTYTVDWDVNLKSEHKGAKHYTHELRLLSKLETKPTSNKFKVGDKVYRNDIPSDRGKIITDCLSPNNLYLIEWEDKRGNWKEHCYDTEISLLPPSEFKVGDRVGSIASNAEGTISYVDYSSNYDYAYIIDWDNLEPFEKSAGTLYSSFELRHLSKPDTKSNTKGEDEMRHTTYPPFNGNEIDTSKPFWIIFCPHCNNVTLKQTEADAKAEAERLTQLTGEAHLLFEQKGMCSPQKQVTWS